MFEINSLFLYKKKNQNKAWEINIQNYVLKSKEALVLLWLDIQDKEILRIYFWLFVQRT